MYSELAQVFLQKEDPLDTSKAVSVLMKEGSLEKTLHFGASVLEGIEDLNFKEYSYVILVMDGRE